MRTAVINIKTDPDIKIQAQQMASEMGLSLSAIVNNYLRRAVKTKKIIFDAQEEIPNERMLRMLRESKKDYEAGRFYSFENVDDALSHIDKLIADEDED